MNNEHWQQKIKEITGEYGVDTVERIAPPDHLQYGINFLKDLKIDDEDKTFLDVRCYNGYMKTILKSKWIGVDIVPKTKDVVIGDLHELNFPEESFDIIFCNHILEHTLSPILCITELIRVLKHDGDLIIGVPIYPGFIYAGHLYVIPEESWIHMFQICKLEIISRKKIGYCCMYQLHKKRK